MDLFAVFVPIVDQPWLALVPVLILAGLAYFTKNRLIWTAAAAWLLYALYEFGVQQRVLCSGECNIRVDLIFIAPALALLTIAAIGIALLRAIKRARV